MFLERHRSWKQYNKAEQKERGDPKTAPDSTEDQFITLRENRIQRVDRNSRSYNAHEL